MPGIAHIQIAGDVHNDIGQLCCPVESSCRDAYGDECHSCVQDRMVTSNFAPVAGNGLLVLRQLRPNYANSEIISAHVEPTQISRSCAADNFDMLLRPDPL